MTPILDRHGSPTPFIELSWREAEARFDRRLDRRRRFAVYEGDEQTLLVLVKWTQHCTGCTEVDEGCPAPEAGCGCDECGYTGKRRCAMWLEESVCSATAGEP
jgi:hypothetical protein